MMCRCGHPQSVHTDWYVEEITGDAGYACRLCSCVEAAPPAPDGPLMTDVSTHWQGCWRSVGHHACAVALLERILASDTWASECAELGCTDDDHSSRSVATNEGG